MLGKMLFVLLLLLDAPAQAGIVIRDRQCKICTPPIVIPDSTDTGDSSGYDVGDAVP